MGIGFKLMFKIHIRAVLMKITVFRLSALWKITHCCECVVIDFFPIQETILRQGTQVVSELDDCL